MPDQSAGATLPSQWLISFLLLSLSTLLPGCNSSDNSSGMSSQLTRGFLLSGGVPIVSATVTVYSSSDGNGDDPHKFVGRSNDGYCYTQSQLNSWMSVDLGAERTVVPTHYCLRNSAHNGHASRNWTLEGRAADAGAEDWQQIKRHDNDGTQAAQRFSVGAWPVDAGGRAFRHLRVRQHGRNAHNGADNNDSLLCCGFEVYGRLLDAEA